MKIIVTGSLGNISKPLTKELVQKGHAVTVISHSAERQKEIEEMGAIAAIGSLEDTNFLVSTFNGADAVYAIIPPNFAAPDSREYYRSIGRSYAQALDHSSVKHVVHLSSWGAHLDKGTGFIVGSHDVEEILNELLDISITHLRPGSFYTNLYSFIDMIKRAGFIGTNYGGDEKIVMVSPKDIAAAATQELEAPANGIKIRYIGSEDITAKEIAGILGAAIGKPDLKWVVFSDDQTRDALNKTGMSTHNVNKIVELNASIHSGLIREDYDLHKPENMGKVKLEDFAKEFAAAYNQ